MKKLVLVTGAGRGIGQAIAIKLAASGYAVAGCARSIEQLRETKELSGGAVRIAAIDVSDEHAVQSWIEEEVNASTAAGEIPWGLVTAAGIYGPIGSFVDNNWEDWKKGIEVNLYGTALAIKFFARKLIEKKLPGRFALLSGGGATQPQPKFSNYSACKAAVVRFGETMSLELREHGINVNCVAPGAVNTKFTDDLLKAGPDAVGQDTYNKVLKQKESGGTPPTRAADLVEFLMSEKAGDLTGKLISAVWDPWPYMGKMVGDLAKSDMYTLRRITPDERPSAGVSGALKKALDEMGIK